MMMVLMGVMMLTLIKMMSIMMKATKMLTMTVDNDYDDVDYDDVDSD